jgi:hypothetical protein
MYKAIKDIATTCVGTSVLTSGSTVWRDEDQLLTTSYYLLGSTVCSRLGCWCHLGIKGTGCIVFKNLRFGYDEDISSTVKYSLYKVKLLLLRLVMGTAGLWHCVLRSAVRISVQNGSGPCVYAVLCIGAGRMLSTLISNKTGNVRIT